MIAPLAISATLPLLRRLDPEFAHGVALKALTLGLLPASPPDNAALETRALGLVFPNPIGLAAGFDKNADAVIPLMRLGFGFVEAGTVTPLPQAGNPKPRLFRLNKDRAIINRMGFNNCGLDVFCQRISRLHPRQVPLGINIGLNKEGAQPERDFPALLAAVTPFADYITINISSPNTPGLRALQDEAQLRHILQSLESSAAAHPPVFVKLAPDLTDEALVAAVGVCLQHSVAGLIIGNTTTARPKSLQKRHAGEAGGLSGPPLFSRSTQMLADAFRHSQGRLLLIGCGGICTGSDVWAKIRAGATLVQIYTAFAYSGPALLPRLKTELLRSMQNDGFSSLAEAIGTAA